MSRGPYRSDPAGVLHVIEVARRPLPAVGDGVRVDLGRLYLSGEGLFFVSGWQLHRDNAVDGLIGALLVADIGAIVRAARRSADPATEAAGRRHLDELRGLSPEQQVANSADSLHVPIDDIAIATIGRLLGPLRVVTRTQGEVHTFELDRRDRSAARTWIAGLPGPGSSLR
ncbi:hypothetical protein [Nannocystis sp.]|uniref:hypothetical protein n=1 Tax=Nannocystis sp. TaxID=1962667 RepID=UPI0025D442AE|nr:hypothetical protein [Nannocystis sp.]MBK7828325.1 hypothetical protein [Nannocystis sp.]